MQNQKFEQAFLIKEKVKKLEKKYEEEKKKWLNSNNKETSIVTDSDIIKSVSEMSGIPPDKLNLKED